MKKFFSAILLMTMMVFSVGTFVSCNDLVEEVQGIQGQVDGQQAAIKALNDEIAVLESALATAQSTADAAKKAADDAAAAAAQAKADAIADAKAQVEALKSAYEGKIAEIEATLAGKVSKEELDAAVKAASDGVNAALEVINTKLATIEATIKDLQDKKADKAELDAEVAKLLEADTKINTQLAALENYIKNLEVGGSANASQIDSIRTELANAAAEIEDLWAFLQDENTGLYALVAGNSSAITAMQEDFQASLDELYADIYGEGPNSLFTMVGQHAGLIQDLDERMTAAEEAILANNQALSIAVAIANQIQSVVYVPTDDNINAMSYQLVANENTLISKTYESPLMIMATYEVSPKSLVETLDDSNVGFATVATKVAGAEYFPAKIVDRDATTGRMIVVGYIDEDSDAYTALTTGTPGDVAKIAFNLNVSVSAVFNVEDEDGLQASINAGTFKVSEYVKAKVATTGKDVLNNVKIGYTYQNKMYYTSDFNIGYEVPYAPVGDATARSLFELYDGLYVDFEGTYLSLDNASDVLGFELVPEYGEFKATYYVDEARTTKVPNGKTSPFVVSGENFETVATLVGSTDYPEEKALHHNVVVAVDGVKLNGAALTNVAISAWYKVGYKKADITLTSTDITWSYKYGAVLDGSDWPSLAKATELDVIGFDDITALYVNDNATGQFAPNTTTGYQFTPSSIVDSKGNNIPVTNEYITIVSLSKKAVRINGGNIPFAKGETLTYKFHKVLYDTKKTAYTVAFEFTTSPMPTDKEIVLSPVQVDAKYNYAMSAPINPILSILAVDGAYYPEANGNDNEKLALAIAASSRLDATSVNAPATPLPSGTGAIAELYKNGQPYSMTGFEFVPQWKFQFANNTVYANNESSVIVLPQASAKAGDKFTMFYEYNIFGVTYTFKVAADVVKATGYTLSTNPVVVNPDNSVLLKNGTVKFPYKASSNASAYTAGQAYELEKIDLRDYVIVNGADSEPNEVVLTYEVLNNVPKPNAWGQYLATPSDYATFTVNSTVTNVYNQGGFQVVKTPTTIGSVAEDICLLNWNLTSANPYGRGARTNEISVRIKLVANNATINTRDEVCYGEQIINLVVPELVKVDAIAPVFKEVGSRNNKGAYSYLVTDDVDTNGNLVAPYWTPVNAVEGLKVTATDANLSTLYNVNAETLYNIWNNIDGTAPVFNVFNQTTIAGVFDATLNDYVQVIGAEVAQVWNQTTREYDITGVSARFQTTGAPVPTDYYKVSPNGKVELLVNSGQITDNIIVTVPVVFAHDFCGSNHLTNVEVLFVK